MTKMIIRVLEQPVSDLLARITLTAPFWLSALSKSIHFDMGVAEMARVGLEPAAGFNMATIAVQSIGSLLIISGRCVWFGAAMFGVFTVLTIPVVHHFWTITEEPFRTIAFHTAVEHIGLVGGLLGTTILAAYREQRDADGGAELT